MVPSDLDYRGFGLGFGCGFGLGLPGGWYLPVSLMAVSSFLLFDRPLSLRTKRTSRRFSSGFLWLIGRTHSHKYCQ